MYAVRGYASMQCASMQSMRYAVCVDAEYAEYASMRVYRLREYTEYASMQHASMHNMQSRPMQYASARVCERTRMQST